MIENCVTKNCLGINKKASDKNKQYQESNINKNSIAIYEEYYIAASILLQSLKAQELLQAFNSNGCKTSCPNINVFSIQ